MCSQMPCVFVYRVLSFLTVSFIPLLLFSSHPSELGGGGNQSVTEQCAFTPN
ncbi:hypothetical protein, unlikely [Trypanosoma brucei gambiense DAL972]|uniref:Uncharacterized protein n=1 Tax=Trypanosoma brucei gambiense (strain MHOM/CI/86/DAL972) TaxID=679716 RepID=C9ZIN2_TRYB9|nr:hypothetical protein, unlikely [Trypanosoma brucei gambiense DAL972]CBH09024.1 hypothetical protein, unlikely [Trypanosoma brucei gambiense DAL972]|eukprot:XP_011771465.1 hypothetical protein, unlikely [Trypanosoma brucei gambiense DAL972]